MAGRVWAAVPVRAPPTSSQGSIPRAKNPLEKTEHLPIGCCLTVFAAWNKLLLFTLFSFLGAGVSGLRPHGWPQSDVSRETGDPGHTAAGPCGCLAPRALRGQIRWSPSRCTPAAAFPAWLMGRAAFPSFPFLSPLSFLPSFLFL